MSTGSYIKGLTLTIELRELGENALIFFSGWSNKLM